MREELQIDKRIVAIRAAIRLVQKTDIAVSALSLESRGTAESASANRAKWYLDKCILELHELSKLTR